MQKTIRHIFFVCIFFIFLLSCSKPTKKEQVLFQTSTINALLEGCYIDDFSFSRLKQKGDFGIGTFNYLDGEMIAFDGCFYQIKSDGNVYQVNDTMKTPFASVTFFKPDWLFNIGDTLNYRQLSHLLDSMLPSLNIIYAIKIEGNFKFIKTRSVPRQVHPFKPLVEIVTYQPTFEFNDIKGIIIGFRLPNYMQGINVPGYHFHFISRDKTKGGHLIDLKGLEGKVSIDSIHHFQLVLPQNRAFYNLEYNNNSKEEMEKVEK